MRTVLQNPVSTARHALCKEIAILFFEEKNPSELLGGLYSNMEHITKLVAHL